MLQCNNKCICPSINIFFVQSEQTEDTLVIKCTNGHSELCQTYEDEVLLHESDLISVQYSKQTSHKDTSTTYMHCTACRLALCLSINASIYCSCLFVHFYLYHDEMKNLYAKGLP